MGDWLALDAAGLLVLSIASLLFAASAVSTAATMARAPADDADTRRMTVLTACLPGFLATMTLVCLSRHAGLLWVAVEATTLVSAPLVGLHRSARSLEATWKYLLVCSVGIAVALLGTYFLAAAASAADGEHVTLAFPQLIAGARRLDPRWLKAAFILVLVGYGTKMGLVPFHTWLPDAHSEAPSAVSALLSGALLNCAFLGVLRFTGICEAAGLGPFARDTLVQIGLLTMVVASALLLGQADYKRLLAWSSVEHMGILAVGIGLGGSGAWGSLFHAANHSLVKAALFLTAGNILACTAPSAWTTCGASCARRPSPAPSGCWGSSRSPGRRRSERSPESSRSSVRRPIEVRGSSRRSTSSPSWRRSSAWCRSCSAWRRERPRTWSSRRLRYQPPRRRSLPRGSCWLHPSRWAWSFPASSTASSALRSRGCTCESTAVSAERRTFLSTANGTPQRLASVPLLEMDAFRRVLFAAVAEGARLSAMTCFPGGESALPAHGRPVPAVNGRTACHLRRSRPRYPSLTPECPSAHLFERAIAEQHGIVPEGHPWLKPVRRPEDTAFYRVEGDEVHEVAVGPVHAGVIEPGHFRFQCHGETVLHLEIALGFQHRGVERLLSAGPDAGSLHFAETLAGDTSVGHAMAYCETVEALCGCAAPARALAIRAVAIELERIANHVGDLGALAGDVAFLPTASFCGPASAATCST